MHQFESVSQTPRWCHYVQSCSLPPPLCRHSQEPETTRGWKLLAALSVAWSFQGKGLPLTCAKNIGAFGGSNSEAQNKTCFLEVNILATGTKPSEWTLKSLKHSFFPMKWDAVKLQTSASVQNFSLCWKGWLQFFVFGAYLLWNLFIFNVNFVWRHLFFDRLCWAQHACSSCIKGPKTVKTTNANAQRNCRE